MKRFAENALIGAAALLCGFPLLLLLIAALTPLTLAEVTTGLETVKHWLRHFNSQVNSVMLDLFPWFVGICFVFWALSLLNSKD